MNEYLNDNISFDEIEKVLSMLHRNKAVGLDQIQNEVLKHRHRHRHRHVYSVATYYIEISY